IVVDLEVLPVHLGGDPANQLAVPFGHEELALRVLEKWILPGIEAHPQVQVERRDPRGITPVDGMGHFDEVLDATGTGRDAADGDVHGRCGSFLGVGSLPSGYMTP